MFAVIRTGGKQYRVAPGDVVEIERLNTSGSKVAFAEVLAIGSDKEGEKALDIGTPLVKGAKVMGEVVALTRGPKLLSLKKRRRKNSRRRFGHRQDLVKVKITEIATKGA
jgi:large subunit ribosomal protein L21